MPLSLVNFTIYSLSSNLTIILPVTVLLILTLIITSSPILTSLELAFKPALLEFTTIVAVVFSQAE